MIVAVSACMNIKYATATTNQYETWSDSSYFLSVICLALVGLYTAVLSFLLWRNFSRLNEPKVRDRFEEAYGLYNIGKVDRHIIWIILNMIMMLICFVVESALPWFWHRVRIGAATGAAPAGRP